MLIFTMQKTTIWRQNYKKFLKCASILRKKYHFAYLLSFLAYKWAEKPTKVQRDNVQCTKEGKGERKKGRKPPDPLKGEGNAGRGERKVKTKTLPVREALLQELL